MFDDRALGVGDRPAEIRGAKLIFRPAKSNGRVYLYFTCDVPDLPCRRLSIKQESCDKYSTKWVCDKIRKELDGADPVTCAVDLGIRHLGAATVRRDGKIVRARFLREEARTADGPRLRAVAAHKRALAAGRRNAASPSGARNRCVELQNHVTDMGEDRFKKGAPTDCQLCPSKTDAI